VIRATVRRERFAKEHAMRRDSTRLRDDRVNSGVRSVPDQGLRLGEVVERTGLTARQLRFWERRGIVTPHRSAGNHRTYTATEVATLQQARELRSSGLSLHEVRLTLRILSGRHVDAEHEGVRVVRGLVARMRAQTVACDVLLDALSQSISRRRTGSPRG
jgi:DNA-binding transcriptional MerR regulator